MFNLGPMEIGLIIVVALLIFGPSRLIELSKSVGKAIHEFKNSMEGKNENKEIPKTIEENQIGKSPEAYSVNNVIPESHDVSLEKKESSQEIESDDLAG